MKKHKTSFDIVIAGVGGQGVITLLRILAESALAEGKDVRTSELHGLSQKGGNVRAHIRFGKNIYSPLIGFGQADMILGLEIAEALRCAPFANKETLFVVSDKIIPYPDMLEKGKLIGQLKQVAGNLYLKDAVGICKRELGQEVIAGVYLLAWAIAKGLIPLKQSSLPHGLKKEVKKEYLEINKKALDLARNEPDA